MGAEERGSGGATVPSAHPAVTADIPPGTPILAAVSGGADSIALWDLLGERHPVTVWHLDHGLRAESAADAAWVAARAARHGAPFLGERVDLAALARDWGVGLEEAGRRHRYTRLAAVAAERGLAWVATGHHADDRLESIVMAILRGGGPGAWRGPRAQRPLGTATLIRPLLRERRADLRAWLTARGESWREDASNTDPRFTRNRIRRLLAEWESACPGFAAALLAEADRRVADLDRLEVAAGALVPGDDLPAGPLLAAPVDIRLAALAAHLERSGVAVDRHRLHRLDDLLAGAPGRELVIGPQRWRRRGDRVVRLPA